MDRYMHPGLLALAVLALQGALSPQTAAAGEIFGTISEGGIAKPRLRLTLQCEGGPGTTGLTDDFGAYRMFVGFEGVCRLGVPGVLPAPVRSARVPQRYNLEIVRPADAPAALRRR